MILQAYCLTGIKFILTTGNYQNIITFLESSNLSFITEMKLNFDSIPLSLHGKGNSENLLEYLGNNLDNSNLIFKFLNYFLTILNIKYVYNEKLIFEFIENDNWQDINLLIAIIPTTTTTTTTIPDVMIAMPYENLDNTLAFTIDGLNWNCDVVTGLEDVQCFYDIFKFGNNCYTECATTENWDNTFKYSIDGGHSWARSSAFGTGITDDFVMDMAYNGSIYIAANDNPGVENSIIYSENGVDWNGIGNTLISRCSKVIWDGNKWLAFASNYPSLGVKIISSINGIDWSDYSIINSSGNSINDVGFNYSITSPLYIASINYQYDSTTIYISTDAISWTSGATLTSQFRWTSNIIFFNNLFITGGFLTIWKNQLRLTGNTESISYSSDGINWTKTADSLIQDVYAISKIGNILVAGGINHNGSFPNMTATSLDGINWTGNGVVCALDEVDGLTGS